MKKTKIVCTLGPASQDYKTICQMMKAGMDVARLNMSHGDLSSHQAMIDTVKRAREFLKVPCAIMLDTRGPEIRIAKFEKGKVVLKKGQSFTFTTKNVLGDEKQVSLQYKQLVKDVKPGNRIFVNNGLVELKVKSVDKENIYCTVVVGGLLSDNKSMNVPGVKINTPYISEIDKEHINFAIDNNLEFIAISFVSEASEVEEVRKYIASIDGEIRIVSKIENARGIKNISSITEASDGIMVARGDMGTEIPIEEIPHVQKKIIKQASMRGKMVITATEMLESMTENRRPTRAETTDVANAIYDGTSATMLSGETAAGKYPVETVKTMSQIAKETEKVINYNERFIKDFNYDGKLIDSVSYSTCSTARALKAKAIVCFTNSGTTARMLSRFRPQTKIIAITHTEKDYNSLALSWGVIPILKKQCSTTEKMFTQASDVVKELKIGKAGDMVVVTAGVPAKEMGSTNLIKIETIQ